MNTFNNNLLNQIEFNGHDLKTKTRQEIADDIGLSLRTFYRRLKQKGYKSEHKLLTPSQQHEIKKLLGFE